MKPTANGRTAIWAITPNGADLARSMARQITGSRLFVSKKVADETDGAIGFKRLKDAVNSQFSQYASHIFIMATGIVVRTIAKHLIHKTRVLILD